MKFSIYLPLISGRLSKFQSHDNKSYNRSKYKCFDQWRPKICFFLELKWLLSSWPLVMASLYFTFFYPNLHLKPSLHKNMFNLSPPLPRPSPWLWMNYWRPLAQPWCCLHAQGCRALCLERASSELDYTHVLMSLIHSMLGYWAYRNLNNLASM